MGITLSTKIGEKPIIFNTEMVKAILDGRKTMTRRTQGLDRVNTAPGDWESIGINTSGLWEFHNRLDGLGVRCSCPYGQVGQRLWVRECFRYIDFDLRDIGELHPNVKVEYKADGLQKWVKGDYKTQITIPDKWRPSIHMPRWASRITLEITEERAERVQEIQGEVGDIIREGVESALWIDDKGVHTALSWFVGLWNSINAERGYGWDTNCWVWVISFKKEE